MEKEEEVPLPFFLEIVTHRNLELHMQILVFIGKRRRSTFTILYVIKVWFV